MKVERRRPLVAVAVAAVALAGAVGTARADGDPASDYLIPQNIFLPYNAGIPTSLQQKLTALTLAAKRAGWPIKVAVIGSSYDLGSVTALWLKPKQYARFLGQELLFVYRGRLLIVMPNGFGFNHPKHNTSREQKLLAAVPIGHGSTGLTRAAITATERLVAASGVKLGPLPVGSPAAQTNHDRVVIIVAVVAFLVLAVASRFALSRWRRTSGSARSR